MERSYQRCRTFTGKGSVRTTETANGREVSVGAVKERKVGSDVLADK